MARWILLVVSLLVMISAVVQPAFACERVCKMVGVFLDFYTDKTRTRAYEKTFYRVAHKTSGLKQLVLHYKFDYSHYCGSIWVL